MKLSTRSCKVSTCMFTHIIPKASDVIFSKRNISTIHLFARRISVNTELVSCITAVDCGQPPDIFNAIKSVEAMTYSSNVTYTCLDGYFFARLVYTQTATCLANGEWSQGVPGMCIRKLELVSIIHHPIGVCIQVIYEYFITFHCMRVLNAVIQRSAVFRWCCASSTRRTLSTVRRSTSRVRSTRRLAVERLRR